MISDSLFQRKRREIRFEVLGTPRPQGSMRNVPHPVTRQPLMISDNKRLMPWRRDIAITAMGLNEHAFGDGVPLKMALSFYFIRPRSARRRLGVTVRPDVDKLIRAILDALKGVLIHDDAQVVELYAWKHYCAPDTPERVEIVIQEAI